MDSMFQTLVKIPLFSGVSQERMAEVIEKAKFHFLKYTPGNDIALAGQNVTHLNFIIGGSVRLSIQGIDQGFCIESSLTAPDVIAPDFLFGRHTEYPCTATAIDTVSILSVSKTDYLDMLQRDRIFQLNYLNTLSMNAQKSVLGVQSLTSGSFEERIAFWVVAMTQSRATDVVLRCRQRDLCQIFGVQRSAMIAALDDMHRRGLLRYDSDAVFFHDRRELVSLLLTSLE